MPSIFGLAAGASLATMYCLTTQSLSLANPPALSQVVFNTYMAPTQQMSEHFSQSVVYEGKVSMITGSSSTESNVKDNGIVQLSNMTDSTYGSLTKQKVLNMNGVMYIHRGHAWSYFSKNSVPWQISVKRMALDLHAVSVQPIPGGYAFRVQDETGSARVITESLIDEVLLRHGFHIGNYQSFQSWIQNHFQTRIDIETEDVDGTQRMKLQSTHLSIDLTPSEIAQYWGTAKSVYPLHATYSAVVHYSYQPVKASVPKGLPSQKELR